MRLLRRIFWRLLLAVAACAETARSSCLPNALAAERRFNFTSPHGPPTPIGVFRGNWPSAMIASNIFKIILEEQVGYHTEFTGTGESMAGAYAVAACTGRYAKGDYSQCDSRWSATHIFLNFLRTPENNEQLQLLSGNVSGSRPQDIGEIGYDESSTAFLSTSVASQALAANGVNLDYYQDYTLASKSPEQFFDKVSGSGYESFIMECSDPASILNDQKVMGNYALVTGDSGPGSLINRAVADDAPGAPDPEPIYNARCWENMFWRAPGACRSDHLKCIPLVTKNSEEAESYMQKATLLGLPFAIGVANNANFSSMPSRFKALFDGMRPRRDNVIGTDMIKIVFPAANLEDWSRGKRGSSKPVTSVTKLVHQDMERFGRRVFNFAKSFALYQTDIEAMVGQYLAANSSYYDIACEFVRQNEAFIVKKFVPFPTNCQAGYGMATFGSKGSVGNASGAKLDSGPKFESNRSLAEGCAICDAGRYSQAFADESGTSYRCTDCQLGRAQAYAGETSCTDCASGSYSHPSKRYCEICDRFHYQPLVRQTSCLKCPEDTMTLDIGAQTLEQCVCLSNLFYPCLTSSGSLRPGCNCSKSMYQKQVTSSIGNCKPCPDFMSCEVGSNEQHMPCGEGDDPNRGPYPKPMAGYYAEYSDPYSIYKCFHEEACTGGGFQACSSNAHGVACGLCERGYWRRAGECRECSTLEKSSGWIMVFILVSVTGFAILYKFASSSVEEWNSPWHRLCSSMYAILAFLQTIDLCISPFPLLMILMKEKYSWSGPMSYLSLFQLRRAQCLTSPSFSEAYALAIAVPWAFIPCFAINYIFFLPIKHLRLEFSIMFNIWGSLLKTIFLMNTSSVLQYFSYYKHPNGQRSLTNFQEILVDSDEHSSMFFLAVLAVLLNVVLPFVLACAVFRLAPRHFQNERFRNWTKFLLVNMRPGVYWWAMIVFCKAIFIGAATLMFEAQESIHAAIMNGMVVYLAAYFVMDPWRSRTVSRMDSAMHVMLCMMIALIPFTFRKSEQDTGGSFYSNQDALSLMFVIVFYSTALATLIAIGVMLRNKSAWGQDRLRGKCEAFANDLCKTFECINCEKDLAEVLQCMAPGDYRTVMDCVNLLQGEMFAVRGTSPRLVWRLQGKLPRDHEDHSQLYRAEAVWT